MYPVLIDTGFVFLPAWHFFYFIAAILVLFLLPRVAKVLGSRLQPKVLNQLYMAGYLGGYFGARALGILTEEPQFLNPGFLEGLFASGPLTFYGGFLGAAVCTGGWCKLRKIPFWQAADPLVVCGFIGLVVGRMGCFLNGDDYGIPVEIDPVPFWAVTFPGHSLPVPRVPVQLMESGLVLLAVLLTLAPRYRSKFTGPAKEGFPALFLTAFYASARFFLEFLRGDYRGYILFPWLSTSQFLSVILLIFVGFLSATKITKSHDGGST